MIPASRVSGDASLACIKYSDYHDRPLRYASTSTSKPSATDLGEPMPRMKGAELITEYLIANAIPYVFGICGHGNVGMLDAL